MNQFITELMEYIHKAEQRNVKVVSIEGIKAIHARHALRNGHSDAFRRPMDECITRDSWRAYETRRGLRVYDHKEVR